MYLQQFSECDPLWKYFRKLQRHIQTSQVFYYYIGMYLCCTYIKSQTLWSKVWLCQFIILWFQPLVFSFSCFYCSKNRFIKMRKYLEIRERFGVTYYKMLLFKACTHLHWYMQSLSAEMRLLPLPSDCVNLSSLYT